MYHFRPSSIDYTRADYQAEQQDATDRDVKRVGNLGEIAFESFCREYLPAEMWEWENEDAIRRCNPESYSGHDFEIFGYEVDVKSSRDVSAFLPENLVQQDADDDIIVMVWHRDKEDSLMLLGWERVETLMSKVETEREFSGEAPERLEHLAARPMNELQDLGPNTAHMNQTPENPYQPGDKVKKRDDPDASVGIVIEVLPPETQVELYGHEIDGEVVRVAFPSALDDGPGDWRDIDAALLSSYCDDQDVDLYNYNHENLRFADNPYLAGDEVIKSSHDDPDVAVVIDVSEDDREVTIVYEGQLSADDVGPSYLAQHCAEEDISTYSYGVDEVERA